LYATGELLGPRLCTLHNLTFFQTLMRDIREAIEANRFADFADDFMRKFRGENDDSV